MAEWFFRKKSKGEVECDPGLDEHFTSNRFTDELSFSRQKTTKDEHGVLISQIVTSKRNAGQETRGGYHKLPYATSARKEYAK